MTIQFTKGKALLLGSIFIISIIIFQLLENSRRSTFYNEKRIDSGLEYGPYDSGNSFTEGFTTHAAPECSDSSTGSLYYPQGATKEEQCVEQCPAPTLPDTKGRCTGGLLSP